MKLDPLPWSIGNPLDNLEYRSAYEPTMPIEWAIFAPREGYEQDRAKYPL